MTFANTGPASHTPVGSASVDPGRLCNVNDAKVALGCGTTKLYELMGEGALDARKLGRRTMITEASIVAYKAGLPKADIRTGRKNAA